VEEGFDVVVRIAELADSSLITRRLAPCRRLVCASPSYLDACGRPERPEDLLAHHRVGYAYEVERSWRFETPGGTSRIAVPVRHRTNNGGLMRELLLAGEGLSLLPTFLIAEDLRSGKLEAVLAESLRADTQIHAVYPHRKHLSAKVRRFVDHLATHYGPRPYWDEGLPV
jgi:DNA-binding transcriptional LysR family regulator